MFSPAILSLLSLGAARPSPASVEFTLHLMSTTPALSNSFLDYSFLDCSSHTSCDNPCRSFGDAALIATFGIFASPDCRDPLVEGAPIKTPCGADLCPETLMCNAFKINIDTDTWPDTIYLKAGSGFRDGALIFADNHACTDGPPPTDARAVVKGDGGCVTLYGWWDPLSMYFLPCESYQYQ